MVGYCSTRTSIASLATPPLLKTRDWKNTEPAGVFTGIEPGNRTSPFASSPTMEIPFSRGTMLRGDCYNAI